MTKNDFMVLFNHSVFTAMNVMYGCNPTFTINPEQCKQYHDAYLFMYKFYRNEISKDITDGKEYVKCVLQYIKDAMECTDVSVYDRTEYEKLSSTRDIIEHVALTAGIIKYEGNNKYTINTEWEGIKNESKK